jgi:predicted TIM-barrel fold metal-dependent hydrolase
MALPKIISVDDHVVEPRHVWQTWLPQKYRERGPKVEDKKWGGFKHLSGAKYDMREDPDGEWGSAWYYDDELIYVHKKFVAIPQASTTLDDKGEIVFDRTQMTMTALCFPTFPRFCGQTFYEAKDKELALACVIANNDWMVEEWCAPSGGVNIPLCIIPLWDVELAAAETKRNAERGVRAIAFSEIPTRLGLPSINSGYWDPLWEVCNDYGVTVCMHVGSSSSNPIASPDSHPAVGGTLGFNNAMASLADWLFSGNLLKFPKLKLAYSEGQIGWIPYVLERADTVWEQHDSWLHAKDRIPVPPSTQYYGRIYGCFTADRHGLRSLEEVGEDNICFETDYPHTDTTWPYSEAYIEKLCVGLTDEVAYKVLRGNAIKMLELDRV